MHFPLFESQGQDNGFFSYQIPLNSGLILKVAGGTKKGMEHELDNKPNQDNYLAAGPLLVIADGLGGHHRGDIASKVVTDCLYLYGQRRSTLSHQDRKAALIEYLLTEQIPAAKVEYIHQELDALTRGIKSGWGLDAVCTTSVGSALSILKKLSPGEGKSIDSTVVAVEFDQEKIFWYHQGDSMLAYLPQDQPPVPLTRIDNSHGNLTATVAMPHDGRMVRSQSIKAGDTYIIFSDCLLLEGRAREFLPQIPSMYQEAPAGFDVPYAAWKLMQEAWKAGDDTSIIVARVESK